MLLVPLDSMQPCQTQAQTRVSEVPCGNHPSLKLIFSRLPFLALPARSASFLALAAALAAPCTTHEARQVADDRRGICPINRALRRQVATFNAAWRIDSGFLQLSLTDSHAHDDQTVGTLL
jgi:hypothetical protein